MESFFILSSWDSAPEAAVGIDIGNVAANAGTFIVPMPCVVQRVIAWSNTAVNNAFTITLDSYDGTTQGAADCGSITIPDSASANAKYYDDPSPQVALRAGDKVLVQVDEAGDSGEEVYIQLVCKYSPETVVNTTNLIASA